MTAARQDAWTADEDLVLAEIVLAHIRDGSTQLQAFEAAGRKLKRTAAACGFRWNSNIRKQYKEAIDLAKKQKKEKKKEVTQEVVPTVNPSVLVKESVEAEVNEQEVVSISDALQYIKRIETELENISNYKKENAKLRNKIDELNDENAKVLKSLDNLTEEYNMLKDEYNSLINVLNKARKMAEDFSA
ncbi:RsfA family transcriptional regulator [Lederbergia graminis]|uniref:RsfA family transcriptional regulator n=1 Tax=Lederbergia graminis TaxID=735518 RepID=A0ABW0LH25_9BACI|nr:RsfA family transcriptional regulator [Paenibacillus bovis]HLU23637.1 RsfA family transcriptional regulator [Bacillaceae bacterium]